MQVLYSGQSMRDAMIEVFKRLPNNGELVIKTVNGESYNAYQPVTIFLDFIRFQDSAGPTNQRTMNIMISAISEISHP
ncbi:hypothetical protein [Bradyrhizobium sp. AUGA SZCCT0160]|uniref:hypothetical protein n=1 Tax=Bradyrhizobium sp. AUGA SZCCT0160 TaxID=2807662 RepID=UPI001BAE0CE9|nr:hypothetical protein [Bradyrhizobium sp. AUGA SZCCT0160]MBR1193225.1 hypothetical protein [Bradyrhizobium sp. AUGA SZCCT0160]